MNRKGSTAVILAVVVIILLAIGVLLYYKSQPATTQISNNQGAASSTTVASTTQQSTVEPPLSYPCLQNGSATLLTYEDQAEGFAFCYPALLAISTSTNDLNTGIHINWPNSYKDSVMGYTVLPSFNFWVTKSDSSSIAASLPQCDLSGARGDEWCDAPTPSQIIQGLSASDLRYAFFRTNFELNHNVIGTSSGPYAYVDLVPIAILCSRLPSPQFCLHMLTPI